MGFGLFLSGLMNLSQRKMKALMDYGHFFDDIRTWKKAAFLAGWMALLKGEYNDKICEEVVEIVSKTSEQTVALSELMTILLTASLYLSGSDIVEANLIKAKSLIDTVLEKPVTSDFTDKQIWFNLFVVQFEVELAILRFTPFVFDRILNLTERVNGITTKTKNIEDHHFISLFGLWRITILTSYIIDFIFIGTTTSEKQSNQKAQNFILASSNINAAVKKLCIVSQRILRKLRAAFISNQIFEIFEGLKFLLEASVISSELSGRSSKISKAISCFEKTKNNIKTEGPTAIRNQLSVLILKFKPKFALESFLSHGTIKQTPSRTNVLGTKVQ